MQPTRTRARRRGHPVAVVIGVAAAFLLGVGVLIVLSFNGGDEKPTKQTVVTTTLPPITTTTLGVQQYTVQAGDTLVAIAERFGVAQSVILDANELPNPDSLFEGQVLKIPPPRVPALFVKPTTIRVGEGIRIKLTGAQTFEQVTFEINSPVRQFVGQSHTATKGGKVITSYTLATDDVPGTYTVIATGDLGTNVQTTFVVEAAA